MCLCVLFCVGSVCLCVWLLLGGCVCSFVVGLLCLLGCFGSVP